MTNMIEKFWEKVDQRGADECWPWLAGRSAPPRGRSIYGLVYRGGKTVKAHRVAYTITKGEIPDGMVVRHTCDNGICVNPNHLILGTQKQNVWDRYERGRDNHVRGEGHGNSKLTAEAVYAIRDKIKAGRSLLSLAREYRVSLFGIQYARDGWKHLEDAR